MSFTLAALRVFGGCLMVAMLTSCLVLDALWRNSATVPVTAFSCDTAHAISTQLNGTTALLDALQASTATELDKWTMAADFDAANEAPGATWHDRWFRLLHAVALPLARLCGLVSARLADGAAVTLVSRPFDYPAYLWGGRPVDDAASSYTDERNVGLWPNGTRVAPDRSNPYPATAGALNLTNIHGLRWRQTAAVAARLNFSLDQLVAQSAADEVPVATFAGKTQLLLGAGTFGAQTPVAPAAPRGLIVPTTFSYAVVGGAIVPKISIPFYVPLWNASRIMIGLASCALSINEAVVPLLSSGAAAVGPGARLFLVDADGFVVADSTSDFYTLRSSDDLLAQPVLTSQQRCVAVPQSRLTACLSHYQAFASAPIIAEAAEADVLARRRVDRILRRHGEEVAFSSAPIYTPWAALSTSAARGPYHPTGTPVLHVIGVRPLTRVALTSGYRAVGVVVPIALFAICMGVALAWAHRVSSALQALVERAAAAAPGALAAAGALPVPPTVKEQPMSALAWCGQATEVVGLDGTLSALLRSLLFADSFVPPSLKVTPTAEAKILPRGASRPGTGLSRPAGGDRPRGRSLAVHSMSKRGASSSSHDDLVGMSHGGAVDGTELDEIAAASDTTGDGDSGYYYGVRHPVTQSPPAAGLLHVAGGAAGMAMISGVVAGGPTPGTPLTNPNPSGDLRVLSEPRAVTVIAINVAGFQTAALGMSPLQVGEFLRSLTGHVLRYARTYGGELDSYHGDHFMITFNAARPCGRHPARAVACAVGLAQRAAATLFSQAQDGNGHGGVMYITAGVATATARCGIIGGDQTRRATILGNVVPRAVAIEGAIRHHPREQRWRATTNGRFRIGVPEDLLHHIHAYFQYECVDVIALPSATSAATALGASTPSAGGLASSTRAARSGFSFSSADGLGIGTASPSQRVYTAIAQVLGRAPPGATALDPPHRMSMARPSDVSPPSLMPQSPIDVTLPAPRVARLAPIAAPTGIVVVASTPRADGGGGAGATTTADGEPASQSHDMTPKEHRPSHVPLVDGCPAPSSPGLHTLALPAAAALPCGTSAAIADEANAANGGTRLLTNSSIASSSAGRGPKPQSGGVSAAGLRDANRLMLLAAAVRRARAQPGGDGALPGSPMNSRPHRVGRSSISAAAGAALTSGASSSGRVSHNSRGGAGALLHHAGQGVRGAAPGQLQEQLEWELAAFQQHAHAPPASPLVVARGGGIASMGGSGGDIWSAASGAAPPGSSAATAAAAAAPVSGGGGGGGHGNDEFLRFVRTVSYGGDAGPGASWGSAE